MAIICRSGDAACETASAFVTRLGLQPVVLQGARAPGSLIERLDGLRDQDFALVLLAAGDSADSPGLLLDVAFLLGALGRGRICFVLEDAAALGPEWDGVARQSMDGAGVWRLLLAREMKQAGLDVDLNRAI